MGFRMTINSAMAISLSLLFFLLLGSALIFLAGLFRFVREGHNGPGRAWMLCALIVGLTLLAVTPVMRPALSVLGRWASRSSDSAATMEKYRAVRAGMTYEDVERVLGGEGTEFTRSDGAGYAMTTYQWDNADGSYVQVTLSNGVVTTKMQFGLSK